MSKIGVAMITYPPKYWLWLQVASVQALSSLVGLPCGEALVFFLVEVPAVFFHGHDRISTLVHVFMLSRVGLFVTPPIDSRLPGSSVHRISQTIILGGFPFPPPEDFPNPGIEPVSPALPGRFFIISTTWEGKSVEPALMEYLQASHLSLTPLFLPGEFQGQCLVGCRLWGRTELETQLKRLSSSSSSICQGGYSWAHNCSILARNSLESWVELYLPNSSLPFLQSFYTVKHWKLNGKTNYYKNINEHVIRTKRRKF